MSKEKFALLISIVSQENFTCDIALAVYDCGEILLNPTQDERGRFVVLIVRNNKIVCACLSQRLDARHLRVEKVVKIF